ncbi:MAG: hypothetical protein JWM80_376 [Cyanobacteria bacterium RYN_339]|nr:hypothetical protein [Cyanobacteria bacterium RYN_339]
MIDSRLETDLRMLKLHDEPRLRGRVLEAHGSVARAWIALGRHLEVGAGVRKDLVSAREAFKEALKGVPAEAAVAAFQLAVLLERHPEMCEEYAERGRTFGTTPAHYFKEGAKLAVAAADARFRFWAANQRTPDLAAAIAPLIARRRHDADFGDPDGMYELSQLQTEGFGVPRNSAAAASWLHRSAKAGHLGAACRLRSEGWESIARLALGVRGPHDDAPALGGAEGPGDAPALGGVPASPFQLLRLGLPRNLPARWAAAVPLLAEGDAEKAEAGDVDAQLRLGAASEDPETAAFWLTQADAAGHPSAFPLRDALPTAPAAEERAATWWERRWG